MDDLQLYHVIDNPLSYKPTQNDIRKHAARAVVYLYLTWRNARSFVSLELVSQFNSNNYIVHGPFLSSTTTIRDLGVIFSTDLSFASHIVKVATGALQLLGYIT